MEVTSRGGPLLTSCATTTHLLSEFLTLQLIPQITGQPRGSFFILFSIFVYVQTSKYKPVFKRQLHHCHRWCKIIQLFLFTVSLFLLYMDIHGLRWPFFTPAFMPGTQYWVVCSKKTTWNLLFLMWRSRSGKKKNPKNGLKKKSWQNIPPEKMIEEETGMSWAANASRTVSAPARHRCECHVGDRKDKRQKQTRLALIPPLRFSSNLHFFSLRT